MNIHTKFEILNQKSNSSLLGLNPWIDQFFILPQSSPVKEQRKLSKKEKNKVEEREKDAEALTSKPKMTLKITELAQAYF